MEVLKFGSVYNNRTVQSVGFVCKDSAGFSLGDTVPGKEISWVKLKNGLIIADRCVCTKIHWEQLHEKGFVFGVPVTIDNKTYLCRCLRAGKKEGKPNEDNPVEGGKIINAEIRTNQ